MTGIGEAGIGKDAADIPDKRIDYIKEQKIFPDGDTTYGDGLMPIAAMNTGRHLSRRTEVR